MHSNASENKDKRFHRLQRPQRLKKDFLRQFLSNRYAVLIVILFLAFVLILLRTADLHLFGQSTHTALESSGSSSELSLSAPRGDIVDRNGVP